jgi:dihydroorotase
VSAERRPIASLDWRGAAASATDLLIAGARVLDPRTGLDASRDIVIRGGDVAELAEPGTGEIGAGEQIDGEGLTAVPAFFDPHVHLRTPGQEHKEDIETGTRAAAAGGYCGIVAMANTSPPVDTPEAILALRERASREASVPVGFCATLTRAMAGEELTEMMELAAAGAAGFTDDGLPVRSARVMRRALQYQRIARLQIALHEEDPELSGKGVMHEGLVAAELGLAGIPSVSESTMIARDAALAAFEDARIHVQHLSAVESVAVVEAAKAAGVQISCEATPHHLTLDHTELSSLDARFKMNPPLRAAADREALLDGLRSGVIDCVATDHAPHSVDEKEVPIESAAMGVTGLETAFAVLHTELVLPGVLDLGLLIERMSAGAAAFDLEPPRIEVGAPANLAILDLAEEWEAGAAGWESRSVNSCFSGNRLTGRVLATIVSGQVAYRNRAFALGAVA